MMKPNDDDMMVRLIVTPSPNVNINTYLAVAAKHQVTRWNVSAVYIDTIEPKTCLQCNVNPRAIYMTIYMR